MWHAGFFSAGVLGACMGLFDVVRRVLGRGGGEETASESHGGDDSDDGDSDAWGVDVDEAGIDPQPGPRRRGGGHGRHWDTAVRDDEQLREVIGTTLEAGTERQSVVEGVTAMEYGAGSLRSRVVKRGENVVSAFPVGDGVVHETTVTEVTPWANDLEADSTIVLGPEEFETYGASAWERGGVPLGDGAVEVTALAYALERADATTYETADGGEFSTSGIAGFVPVEGGGVADYAFQSTVRAVERVRFFDANGYRFRVPLTRTGDAEGADGVGDERHGSTDVEEWETWLYAGPHAIDGTVPEVGDDVSGVFWVQTHVE